jgi:hypothetical protein
MIRIAAALLVLGCTPLQMLSQSAPKQPGQTGVVENKKLQGNEEKPVGQEKMPAPAPSPAEQKSAAAASTWQLDNFREFSAVVTGSFFAGDERKSFIYRSGDLMRTSGPGPQSYVVTNLKKSQFFGVSPKGCNKGGTLFFRVFPFDMNQPERKFVSKDAGTETIDGHECRVEDVTVSDDGPRKPSKFRLWEANDLQGFPVKIDFDNGNRQHATIRYSNIVIGPQDPTLFVYPSNCSGGATTGAATYAPKKSPPTGTK